MFFSSKTINLTVVQLCAGPEATEEQLDPNFEQEGFVTTFAKRLVGLDYKRDIQAPSRSPIADMNQILKMKSITTDTGRARAWIRLSIEKRLLSHHLRDLGFKFSPIEKKVKKFRKSFSTFRKKLKI